MFTTLRLQKPAIDAAAQRVPLQQRVAPAKVMPIRPSATTTTRSATAQTAPRSQVLEDLEAPLPWQRGAQTLGFILSAGPSILAHRYLLGAIMLNCSIQEPQSMRYSSTTLAKRSTVSLLSVQRLLAYHWDQPILTASDRSEDMLEGLLASCSLSQTRTGRH